MIPNNDKQVKFEKTRKHRSRENVCEVPAGCPCSFVSHGSAILCVGFDLNFPPAPCLFDKIDDDHYCVQAFPPSRIVSLIYSINASICINGLHRMCCLVQYLVTVLFMMMRAIR